MRKAVVVLFAMFVVTLGAWSADAQSCSPGGYCNQFNCYWYDHLVDGTFEESCSAWGYEGAASLSSETFCNGTQNVGKIAPNSFTTTGIVAQTVFTNNSWYDDFILDFILESSNMGTLYVYLDVVGGSSILVDTITSANWCANKSYQITNQNLKGKLVKVRFQGTGTANSTVVKLDYVNFWQRYQ